TKPITLKPSSIRTNVAGSGTGTGILELKRKPTDVVSPFFNSGPYISLVAPGERKLSTLPTYPGPGGFTPDFNENSEPHKGKTLERSSNYGAWSGTSMATPMVASAAALLLSTKGEVVAGQVREFLMASADKVPAMKRESRDPDYGAGRLNIQR